MGFPEPLHLKKIAPKPLRPGMILLFITTALLWVAIPLRGSSQVPITFERFSEQMLKQRDVDHVTTYKSGDLLVAEVFLKRESLNKGDYADAKKTDKSIFPAGDNSTPPQYVFTAATYDGLAKAVYDAETRFGYKDADRISVGIEAGHEGVLANWVVQCIIMIFLLILLALCGYLGYKSGKNRIIGSIPGLLLGFVLGPRWINHCIRHRTKTFAKKRRYPGLAALNLSVGGCFSEGSTTFRELYFFFRTFGSVSI